MASCVHIIVLTVLAFCVTESGGEWCTVTRDSWWGDSYDIIECDSCCGYWPDQYCCTNIGGIVGGVLTCLFFLGVVVVVVVLVKKHQKSKVSVVHGSSQPVPTVAGTVVYQHPPPPHHYPPPQPGPGTAVIHTY
ncbi:uncharacterized protein LOC143285187 [Babylonia areolata]|uniref:uncharacterized protein LOC143285187 n=1 Tax=Babylonia areolata TaxID=304850 RepID=UPI003FD4775C